MNLVHWAKQKRSSYQNTLKLINTIKSLTTKITTI